MSVSGTRWANPKLLGVRKLASFPDSPLVAYKPAHAVLFVRASLMIITTCIYATRGRESGNEAMEKPFSMFPSPPHYNAAQQEQG